MRIGLAPLLMVLAANLGSASAAEAHEGWGIVRDGAGRLYVTDIPANTVWRIGADGRIEPAVGTTHSHALVLGRDGAVYGTNVHLTQPIRSLWRIEMDGRVNTVIAPTRGLALDLQAFLVGGDGTVYSVTPHESSLAPEQRSLFIVRRSPQGVIDSVAGGLKGYADGTGRSARFSSIDGKAWLPDASILIADGARLRRVSVDGAVTTLTPPLTEMRWDQDIMGLSVGENGVVYVADFAARRVLSVSGDRVATVASTGWYWSPTGVLATGEGVYTLEHPRAPVGILGDLGVGPYLRVRLIRPDGTTETLARIWGRRSMIVIAAFALIVLLPVIGLRRRRRRRFSEGTTQ